MVQCESNDGVAFSNVSWEKDDKTNKGKKKEISCFRFKKVGHYSNEYEEELSCITRVLMMMRGRLMRPRAIMKRKMTLMNQWKKRTTMMSLWASV